MFKMLSRMNFQTLKLEWLIYSFNTHRQVLLSMKMRIQMYEGSYQTQYILYQLNKCKMTFHSLDLTKTFDVFLFLAQYYIIHFKFIEIWKLLSIKLVGQQKFAQYFLAMNICLFFSCQNFILIHSLFFRLLCTVHTYSSYF